MERNMAHSRALALTPSPRGDGCPLMGAGEWEAVETATHFRRVLLHRGNIPPQPRPDCIGAPVSPNEKELEKAKSITACSPKTESRGCSAAQVDCHVVELLAMTVSSPRLAITTVRAYLLVTVTPESFST